ncbi:MAG: hypothetical protein C4547_12835 [Phycisphaerales bacterium]|nr:MAG: hypothetical protein C4547_12835 [Phycisphaerales bacterium]
MLRPLTDRNALLIVHYTLHAASLVGLGGGGGSAIGQCSTTEFGWAATVGDTHFDGANAVAVTPAGATFVTGTFTGDVDFNPGNKGDRHNSKGENDIFLSRYTPLGDYQWTVSMGGSSFDYGFGAHVTVAADVLITGSFRERVDFDATRTKDRRKSAGGADIFLTLIHGDGSYGWTRTIGGPSSPDSARAVTTDGTGDIILTGAFCDTVDFDPGKGVDRHTAVAGSDIFVTKLSSHGNFRWARAFGGDSLVGGDYGWAVATDGNDNSLATGQFYGRADFDPGPGEDIHHSMGEDDAFITSFGPGGEYRWTHTFGGTEGNDTGKAVVTDGEGNVYVAGSFAGTVDFDRRGAGDVRVARGASDAFLTCRTLDGSYRWTRTLGGDGTVGASGLAYNACSESLVLVGAFADTVDFDPGSGIDQRTARGQRDGFLTRLSADGVYLGTVTFGGDGDHVPQSVAVDAESSILVAGGFQSSGADFDPTTGEDIHASNGGYDLFVLKLYCGPCESVERHALTVTRKNALIGEVRALVPGGRVTVVCTPTDPPGEPVEARVSIDGENMGSYKLKKLKKGEYACAITEVRDADGKVVCDEPAGKRTVTVK